MIENPLELLPFVRKHRSLSSPTFEHPDQPTSSAARESPRRDKRSFLTAPTETEPKKRNVFRATSSSSRYSRREASGFGARFRLGLGVPEKYSEYAAKAHVTFWGEAESALNTPSGAVTCGVFSSWRFPRLHRSHIYTTIRSPCHKEKDMEQNCFSMSSRFLLLCCHRFSCF